MKLLLPLLFLFSCSHVSKKPDVTPAEIETPAPSTELPTVLVPPEEIKEPPVKIPEPTPEHPGNIGEASQYEEPLKPLPSASGYFTTNINLKNCSEAYVKKSQEAASYIKAIFNSEDFKNAVLAFSYNGKKQFVDNTGLTNSQIYEHLIKGAEALNPVINYQMDLGGKCYYSNNSTVGYTYPSDKSIYLNTKFHYSYSVCSVASNTTHEWSHKMGFPHAVKWSTSRDYSVPYGMNKIVEKLCPLAKVNKLTPLKAKK